METEQLTYDSEADVLYLWKRDPSEVEDIRTEETDNEILLKRDAETGEQIGVAVLHLASRDEDLTSLGLPSVPRPA